MHDAPDDSIVTDETNLDPQQPDGTETVEGDPQPEVEEVQQQPAQPQRQQPRRSETPVYRPSERITRAREQFKNVDETLGANGKLNEAAACLLDTAEALERENAALRVQVQQHDQNISGIDFWQSHGSNPANKNYPVADAQADLERIRGEVENDPAYAGLPDETRKVAMMTAARERFFAHAERVRAGSTTNNTTDNAEPVQQQPLQQQPRTVVRQVGSPRVVPRGSRPIAPPPAKRMSVQQMIEQDAMPAEWKQGYEEEFDRMSR